MPAFRWYVREIQGALALLLGTAVGIAGLRKLHSGAAFERALAELVRPSRVPWLKRAIPVSELVLAAWLLSGSSPRAAGAAVVGVLALFSLALVRLARAGRSTNCGCFGEPVEETGPPLLGLLRNAALASAAAALVLAPAEGPIWHEDFSTAAGQVTVALGLFLVWYCVAALAAQRERAREVAP